MSNLHKLYMKIVDSLVKMKLEENPRIELVLIGGSVARGDETIHSDIDINFYVKKEFLPASRMKCYEYKGKFVDETFIPLEEFNSSKLIDEVVVLFDKNGITSKIRRGLSEKEKNKVLVREWERARGFQRLSEAYYENGEYEKSVYHTLGSEGLAYNLCLFLPARLNLPFPSFRLLKTMKKINTGIYDDLVKLFSVKDFDKEKVLRNYEKVYKIIADCYKQIKPGENLGFFNPLKIKYNIDYLKLTFKDYPPAYDLKFIVGCVIDWALKTEELWKNKKNQEYKSEVVKLTKEILGIKEFNKEYAKEKLELSKKLEKRTDKLIKKITATKK